MYVVCMPHLSSSNSESNCQDRISWACLRCPSPDAVRAGQRVCNGQTREGQVVRRKQLQVAYQYSFPVAAVMPTYARPSSNSKVFPKFKGVVITCAYRHRRTVGQVKFIRKLAMMAVTGEYMSSKYTYRSPTPVPQSP